MENFKSVQNGDLLKRLKAAVHSERRVTIAVLEYLDEIEHRRIHAEKGYSSLHEFCVGELKYSDGSTYRRISSMKLMKELNELGRYLQNGKITLSMAARLYRFFQREERLGRKYSLEQKNALLHSMMGKSVRECELILMTLSPDPVPSEYERILTTNQTEIRFVASDVLLLKLSKVKSLFAYRKATFGYADLFEAMAETILKQLDPIQWETGDSTPSRTESRIKRAKNHESTSPEKLSIKSVRKFQRPYIKRSTRRVVWQRYRGRCAYTDPISKRRCTSQHALQIDHIVALGLGGSSNLKNLRLLCRMHNQMAAFHAFGAEKMSKYVSRLR